MSDGWIPPSTTVYITTSGAGSVAGHCPACGWETLFLAAGGHVTCARLDCPRPTAADELLADRETEITDLHARCVAEVARLRAIAESAADTSARMSLTWPRALFAFWHDWSPAACLRVCDWAGDVLRQHVAYVVPDGHGRESCPRCLGDWPCDEVLAVARALDIPEEPQP